MATSRPKSSTAKKRELLTCAICLDIYKSPKLLPCFHSFCEQCLKNLSAQHPGGAFPCPACRKQTTVPPAGVSAFQANFHIDPDDLKRARGGTYCTVHTEKRLEFYCVLCDVAICVNCNLTEHKMHETKDLTKAAETAKLQLTKDKLRLKIQSFVIRRNLMIVQNDLGAVGDKKSTLQIAIKKRHATLQEAIDRYRDEALASLGKVTDDIVAVQKAEIFTQQKNLQELTKLQERVQQALNRGAGSELVTVVTEMRCGRGSREAVSKLTTKQMTTCYLPVLRFTDTLNATLKHMRDYMGSAAKEEAVPALDITTFNKYKSKPAP